MPVLETERLRIRPFTYGDLADLHRILDTEPAQPAPDQKALTLASRESWLRWTIAGYDEHAKLLNPPYGDRAIELRNDARELRDDERESRDDRSTLVGACGLVPSFAPFGLVPSLGEPSDDATDDPRAARYRPEVGIYYAIAPEHRRRGYATEAARALIHFALHVMSAARVVATTTHDNAASIAVMRRAGMRVLANPHAHPEWLQVVGVKD